MVMNSLTPQIKLEPLKRTILRVHRTQTGQPIGKYECEIIADMLFREAHDASFPAYGYKDIEDFVTRRLEAWGYLTFDWDYQYNPVNAASE